MQLAALLVSLLACVSLPADCAKYSCADSESLRAAIRDSDFTIVIDTDSSTTAGACSFSTAGGGERQQYHVTIVGPEELRGGGSLWLRAGDDYAMKASGRVEGKQRGVVTPPGRLTVGYRPGHVVANRTAAASGKTKEASSLELRVRRLVRGCPPAWRRVGDNCFGSGPSGLRLTFADSIDSCRLMLANLLHVPFSFRGDVRTLRRQLRNEAELAGAWIGVVVTYDFDYMWLDGGTFSQLQVACDENPKTECRAEQRCGALATSNDSWYSVRMRACSEKRLYVCHMPAGGANGFHSMPPGDAVRGGPEVWDERDTEAEFGSRQFVMYLLLAIALLATCAALAALCLCSRPKVPVAEKKKAQPTTKQRSRSKT